MANIYILGLSVAPGRSPFLPTDLRKTYSLLSCTWISSSKPMDEDLTWRADQLSALYCHKQPRQGLLLGLGLPCRAFCTCYVVTCGTSTWGRRFGSQRRLPF